MTRFASCSWNRTFALLFASGALALGAAGCHNDPTKAPGSVIADPLPRENYPKLEALEGLAGYIAISGVNVTPATDRTPLEVNAGIRSLADQTLAVQYRFFFLDAAGNPINPNPDWRFMQLPSRSLLYMQGNAMDTNATDWRLQIRPAR